ncbi:Nicotinate-nucleotide adenylyltransferase [Besnoitia besnoiti]|uniref:Nicotinate-nucleotide adenylyltransferase n=1 Tax=Besnoitia besnoiti TaxID=94643 RepID=A0A2A9M3F8_BESBE|nr:Nicotinate-nucleotide adenylyltransferase [Besnoitia besnoiti]PFH32479.1 Nicotinate-nucleotide adenylyltransferase [Besnoitia besnoiti]
MLINRSSILMIEYDLDLLLCLFYIRSVFWSSVCYFGGSFDPPTYGHMLSAAGAVDSGAADEVWLSPCGGDPAPLNEFGAPTENSLNHAEVPQNSAGARDVCARENRETGGHVSGEGPDLCGMRPGFTDPPAAEGERPSAGSSHSAFKVRPDKVLKTPAALRLEMTRFAVAHFFGSGEQRRCPVRVLEWEALTAGYTPTFKVLKRLEAEHPDCEFSILIGEDILPNLSKWYNAPGLIAEYAFLILPRSSSAHHMPLLFSSGTCTSEKASAAAQNLRQLADSPARGSTTPQEAPADAPRDSVTSSCLVSAAPPSASAASLDESPQPSSNTVEACQRGEGRECRCLACTSSAAAAAEAKLQADIECALKRLKRADYVDQLCMQRGRPYFPWPASSSYVRQLLSTRRERPTALIHCSALIAPAVCAFIERHGLYAPQ